MKKIMMTLFALIAISGIAYGAYLYLSNNKVACDPNFAIIAKFHEGVTAEQAEKIIKKNGGKIDSLTLVGYPQAKICIKDGHKYNPSNEDRYDFGLKINNDSNLEDSPLVLKLEKEKDVSAVWIEHLASFGR